MNERPPAVEVRGLTKRYRRALALDDVSLRIEHGEIVGVLGPNGAGKTTLIETIAGLRRPYTGTIEVLGLDPRRDRAALRQVLGVQLQHADLHDALTARELVRLFASFYPHPRGIDETLEIVGLGSHARTRFQNLSGGQQQRLSVAVALVGRPRVLVLDELTTGLDPSARRRMWTAIERLRGEGVTIVLVSHAMDEVERLCDRVVLLASARIVAEGTPADIVSQAGAESLEDAFVALTGVTVNAHEMEEDPE